VPPAPLRGAGACGGFSGAIQEHGLSVNTYFMLNVVVASECYDSTACDDSTNGHYMVNSDFYTYELFNKIVSQGGLQ
jgi:hypothetical protein